MKRESDVEDLAFRAWDEIKASVFWHMLLANVVSAVIMFVLLFLLLSSFQRGF